MMKSNFGRIGQRIKLLGPCPIIGRGILRTGSVVEVSHIEARQLIDWGKAELATGEPLTSTEPPLQPANGLGYVVRGF
jgi:hypothetical protein